MEVDSEAPPLARNDGVYPVLGDCQHDYTLVCCAALSRAVMHAWRLTVADFMLGMVAGVLLSIACGAFLMALGPRLVARVLTYFDLPRS